MEKPEENKGKWKKPEENKGKELRVSLINQDVYKFQREKNCIYLDETKS